MNWDRGIIKTAKTKKMRQWIRESIKMRKRAGDTINRYDGASTHSHTWDFLI